MSLMQRLIKNSTIKETDILADSKFFHKKDMITTMIPAINLALSGSISGGLTPGLLVLAGPSKHFKTSFSLIMAKAYLDKYPESVLLFYDSEFGTPQSYFKSAGIPLDRVVHTPITDLEQFKFDLMSQMGELERADKIVIVVDSIGNLASKKEVEDALKQNSAADMTRAKQMKSVFRMVTPHLTMKDIPMIVVNHVYMEQGMFPKAIVSGGTGVMYSANTVFIIGRQQEKDGTEVIGYNFVINVEKSRFVKEKSKIPIEVTYEGGVSRWGGLLDLALESSHVIKPKNGWYQKINTETGEYGEKSYRLKDTYTSDFWLPLLKCPKFNTFVENKYRLPESALMQKEDSVDQLMDSVEDDE